MFFASCLFCLFLVNFIPKSREATMRYDVNFKKNHFTKVSASVVKTTELREVHCSLLLLLYIHFADSVQSLCFGNLPSVIAQSRAISQVSDSGNKGCILFGAFIHFSWRCAVFFLQMLHCVKLLHCSLDANDLI